MEVSKKKVSNYIPRDISFDILSKLSVKSLKRFTCVCKFWDNLFEKPQFMNMYRINLSLSKYNDCHNSHLLLKQTPDYGEFDYNDNIFLFSGETFHNKVKLNWPPPFEVYREGIFIIGSIVNGILCLCQGNGRGYPNSINTKVVLWNPSTEEFKLIPCGSLNNTILKAYPPNTMFEDLPVINTFVNIHGFGYDPVTDDYKLIRYFYFSDDIKKYDYDPNDFKDDEASWQLYSLKSNCWRDLQVKTPKKIWSNYWQENGYSMYFNGMCHWWGYEDYHKEEVLVSFNLSDEVFITTNTDPNYCGFNKHMMVLKDCISMIEYNNSFNLYISVLGEIGVAESWTRLFRIGPLQDFMGPIGVGKNGDIFFDGCENIERFDLNTGMIGDIGITGRVGCCQMVIYDNSILPIG